MTCGPFPFLCGKGKKARVFYVLSFLFSFLQSHCSEAYLFGWLGHSNNERISNDNRIEEEEVKIDYKDGKVPSEPDSVQTPPTPTLPAILDENLEETEEILEVEIEPEQQGLVTQEKKTEEEENVPIEEEEKIDNTAVPNEEKKVKKERNQKLLHSTDYYERRYLEWQEEFNFVISEDALSNEKDETIHRLLQERYEIFVQNDIYIEKHNEKVEKKEVTFKLNHNEFSHLSYNEFLTYKLGYGASEEEEKDTISNKVDNSLNSIKVSENLANVESRTSNVLYGRNNPTSYYFEKYNGNLFHAQSPEMSKQNKDNKEEGRKLLRSFSTAKVNGNNNRNLILNVPPSKVYYESDYNYDSKNLKGKEINENVVILYPTKTKNEIVSIYIDEGWQFYSTGVYSTHSNPPKKNTHHVEVTLNIQEYGNNVYKVIVTRGNSSYTFFTSNLLMVTEETVVPPTESNGSVSAVDCGGSTIAFSDLQFTPDDLEKEQLATMKATGVLTSPLQTGTFQLKVILEGTEIYNASGDICNPDTEISLPADSGTLNIYGVTCPADPGPIEFGLDVVLPSIAPNGDYTIQVRGTDQDETPLLCIDVDLQLA